MYGYDQPADQIFSGYYGAEIVPRGVAFEPDGNAVFTVASTWNGSTYVVTYAVIPLFAPTVTGVSPQHGPSAGGTTVTIAAETDRGVRRGSRRERGSVDRQRRLQPGPRAVCRHRRRGGTLLDWKESGGNAGTCSPNAAFVQSVLPVQAGHTYTFTLTGKPNQNEAGAGTSTTGFSPTRLTVATTE